jgi:Fe2+ or Zn2+ uptake regulation protein
VEGCRQASVAQAPHGFVIEDHELVWYGRCATCAKVA